MLLESFNPANGDVVGAVRITPVGEIPALVTRARTAFPAWRALGLEGRAALIREAGPPLFERALELGALLTRETGRPVRDGIGEVRSCGLGLDALVDEIVLGLRAEEEPRARTTSYQDPYGVCAVIAPWNFPIAVAHGMILPALIAGNTVVFKPSEQAPLIGDAYATLMSSRLPPDVLQVVHGADAQGRALIAADVNLIAFTGSRVTGAKIMATVGRDLKKAILELSGKDALIVLDDADVDRAAAFAVANSFHNAGHVSVNTERIYVQTAVAEPFERAVARGAAALRVGDGSDEATDIGPVISEHHKERVLQQLGDAMAKGARFSQGGQVAPGNFIFPTVLVGVTHEMDIMRTETFGPVACVARFDTDDDAVRLANQTPYGVGAVVFGRDEARTLALARRLDAEMTWIHRSCDDPGEVTRTGSSQGGYGSKSDWYSHRQFTQTRIVSRGS
jgi:acyl-CoA reductase-like NAD-dependent aldehyde dehydrogenase